MSMFTNPDFRKYLLEEFCVRCARVSASPTIARRRERSSFSFEGEESLACVTGLWNMQEWRCAATCDSGKQQRVSRVQTPRHFMHPWIICGAMPNASTTARHDEPFNMHAPAGCSCTRIPKTPTTNKPVAPGHRAPRIQMTITDIPRFKERPVLHAIYFFIFFFKGLLYSCLYFWKTRLRRWNLIS